MRATRRCATAAAGSPRSGVHRLALVGLLLLAGAAAAHAAGPPQQPAGPSSSNSSSWGSRLADQLLQRLQWAQQPFSSQRGTDATPPTQQQQQPDFSSTANVLTTQAVQQADTRIAVLESQAALDLNTTAAGPATDPQAAALNASSGGDLQEEEPPQQPQPGARSTAAPAAVSPLQLLLRSISRQWSAAQARQGQQQQQQQRGADLGPAPPDAMQLWLGALDRLAADQPNLAAFARLVRNDSLLQREVAQTQLLPAVLLAPTNAALTTFISASNRKAAFAASSSSNSSSGPAWLANTSSPAWQQLVDDFAGKQAVSTPVTWRHVIPVRQPQLLDASGDVNSQLLARHNTPLVFSSLVLKTKKGSFIQVSELPPGPGAELLAAAAKAPAALEAANSSTQRGRPSRTLARLLTVGVGGSALARPFLLQPPRGADTQPLFSRAPLIPTLVLPVDVVLDEQDEVVTSMTAQRLRGAFGWVPEDERALLSRVYLDPAASYWRQASGFVQQGGSSSEGGSANGSSGTGRASGLPDGRRLLQDATGGSSNPGSGSGPGPDSSSSSSSSPATSPGGPPAPSGDAPQQAMAGQQQGSDGAAGRPVPAAVAESRARQQQQLVQVHMADALAANLMTVEAVRAFVSAVVLRPDAVFEAASLQLISRLHLPGRGGGNSSAADSGTSNAAGQCWAGDGFNDRSSGSRDRSAAAAVGQCPQLVDWSSICNGGLEQPPCTGCSGCTNPGSGVCRAQGGAAAASNSRSSSCSTGQSLGRVSQTWLIGLSPYQLFPSLGITSSSTPGSAPPPAASGIAGSSNSSAGSGGGGQRRKRHRRALHQLAPADTSAPSPSPAPAPAPGGPGVAATAATAAVSAVSAVSATEHPAGAGGGSSSPSSTAPTSSTSPVAPTSASSGTTPAAASSQGFDSTFRAKDSNKPAAPPSSNSSSNGSSAPPADSSARAAAVSTDPDSLAFTPITQLAKLLADGSVTPQQLADAFSARSRRYDSLLNPVVTFTDALAKTQAAAAQQALAAAARAGNSSRNSLLLGVPWGLKDLFAAPGYPTSWGMWALRNRVIDTPSWAYTALSGCAGAVLLAKTATGELAWGDTWFENRTTRNPWQPRTGSCGSSAGSAAAVAAGLLPFAIGSETWGSIVCPASTVGVTAFRPTGGTIRNNGMLQVSPTLDKTGVFCRAALDCAVVADALMDASGSSGGSGCATAGSRLHLQPAAAAAAFNYSCHQAQAGPPNTQQQHTVLPATFEGLPRLADLCIGFIEGASSRLVATLRAMSPACLKGPLPPPGSTQLVQDVLPVLLLAEVAVSYEGLWLEGRIGQRNHWYPSVMLGQLAPAATYLRAHQLRAVLAQQARAYFAAHGIHVLIKPTPSLVGLDGLGALLDMPELLLPVGMYAATLADAQPVVVNDAASSSSSGNGSSGPGGASSMDRQQQQRASQPEGDSSSSSKQSWQQPEVNSLLALPGDDAAVVAVAAAFQAVTDWHLRRPPLPEPEAGDGGAAVASG